MYGKMRNEDDPFPALAGVERSVLENMVRSQYIQITDLQKHNTELLERARKAEQERDAFRDGLLAAAKMGGMLARELTHGLTV